MTTIRAHFDGKVFVPDEPTNIPVNQQATIYVEESPLPPPLTMEEFEQVLQEMDRDAIRADQGVDWSRESIYSGTLDDPR